MKNDLGENFQYNKGKSLGLLDIVVGAQAGNYKAVHEALKMEVIHPHMNSEFLSWVDALKEYSLVKETLPPHDKLVAGFIEQYGPLN